MKTNHDIIELDTDPGTAVYDITPHLRALVADWEIGEGFAVISSRHTTTALTINENESRLLDDLRLFLHRLVPPEDRYLHDDIHLRDCPADEPQNAHAHIAAMLLGQSEAIPIIDGELHLGTWQSVLLVELDGPRRRTVGVHVTGE
jgi:secondary thiamine-phosphate synthase enzyme